MDPESWSLDNPISNEVFDVSGIRDAFDVVEEATFDIPEITNVVVVFGSAICAMS